MPTHLKYIHFKQSNIHIATASRISRMLLLFFAVSLFLTRVVSDYAPHLCPRLLSSTHLSPIYCDPSPANHHRLLPSVESLPCWIVVLTCVSVDPAWLVSSLCFLVLLPNLFFLCRLPYPYLLLLPCGPWVGVSELSWIGFGGFVTHGLCEEECEGFPALDIVPLDSLEPPSPVAVYISPGVHL